VEDRTPQHIRHKLRLNILKRINDLREEVRQSKNLKWATPVERVVLREFTDLITRLNNEAVEQMAWFMRDNNLGEPRYVTVEAVAQQLAKQALFEASEAARGRTD